MRIGRLRHRVEVQSPSDSVGSDGYVTTTWSTDTTRWASIEPLKGSERVDGDRVVGEVSHRVWMRTVSGLDSSKRLKFGTRTFHIVSVRDIDERGITNEVLCKETV